MPAVRNRGADIGILASSFLRHWAFRSSSFAPLPTGNAFPWNAKRLDPQLGWYVYHFRHYRPELGRWPSRDPIEEDGGVNLYGFVGNGPLTSFDFLGQAPFPVNRFKIQQSASTAWDDEIHKNYGFV